MKFAHRVPAVLAAAVAVSVLPGGGRRLLVGAQTSTVNTDFLPNGGSAADCVNTPALCAAASTCEADYGGTGIHYCVCNDGYTGDGLAGAGDTGCNNIDECADNTLNDCIALSTDNNIGYTSGSDICEDTNGSYVCNCPTGTVGASDNSETTDAAGGDGKTLASGGSGCPADSSGNYADEATCEAACVSPDASCYQNYLSVNDDTYSCACNDGYKGDGTDQEGCTRLAPVLGEQQTLGTASQNIDDAIGILDTYLKAKDTYEEKQCRYMDTTDACTAATALYNETLAAFNRATFEYDQAVDYQEQKLADWAAANATDGTAAERTRLESAAKDAWEDANEAEGVALAAKTAADTAQQNAYGNMTDVCDTNTGCTATGDVAVCVGLATDEQTNARTDYNDAKEAAEGNNLIPEILTPDTADVYKDPFDEFVYDDSDGDLIPDKFDACPTQMGLRRNRRAQGNKLKSSVGGVGYVDNEDVWTNFTDPGPQDFCPSGCPETDENDDILDTDGDGIRDCEDRCPFVAGIRYNHAWTKDKWTNATTNDLVSLDRNLDYNGCPDFDEDGIPDIFDQCPGCVWDDENNVCTAVAINENSKGGVCYSGCPDPGDDPATGQPFDTDLDGVPDCLDRCPGIYAPDGNITTTHGCPDLDLDGTPDYLDYCPVNPGDAEFDYIRKLESAPGDDGTPASAGYWQPGREKWLTILGCPDRDGDFVPDTVDMCDSCAYPNQPTTNPYQQSVCNRLEDDETTAATGVCNAANIDGVVVVDRVGCPLDSDQDGVFDGIDMCDGTIHSANDIHDDYAIVYKASDEGYDSSAANDGVLGCPKDDDGDGVANGIDQCPDVGGYINEDGCPIDSDGDGVSDCASDVGGMNSVLASSRFFPTWPFTIGHLTNDAENVCHSTTIEPRSETTAADNCCNVAYDNCDGTPKFVDVTNAYTPSDSSSPVTGNENDDAMGCAVDTDKDGVDDGRDRCPYSTKVEVDYFDGLDPAGNAVDVSGLISRDTFGCIVTLPPAWDVSFVDAITNITADDNTLDGITDLDGDANPDLQLLFTTPKLLWDVQESRGVASPPDLDDITSSNVSPYTYDSGTANELIKATVFDYSCTKKFDDSTNPIDPTNPTPKLLPTAVIRGVGKFPEEILDGVNEAGDKNIPAGSQPFYVDVELNPDGLVGSEIWKIEPPFDEASIEFCLRVDLYSDNEESVNFMELKTIVKIDMTQGFKVSDTEIKRNEATTEETQIDIQYPLRACHCQGEDFNYECVEDSGLNDEFVKQDDAMSVCVRFEDPLSVPAYVRMTDLKMFTCTQGTLSHTPVLDFVRAQDGLTSVDITDNGALVGDNDRMIVVSTNLPSAFFGTTASAVDCEGTLVYDFTQNAAIGGRRTAEASIRAIAPPAKSDEERKLNESEEEFSVKVPLAPAGSESSTMSAGLIAGVSVAGVVGAAAVGLLVTKTIPAVRVTKMANTDGRRLSYETDHSISDNSPNHYLDQSEGYVA